MGYPPELENAISHFDANASQSSLYYGEYLALMEIAKRENQFPSIPILKRKLAVAQLSPQELAFWRKSAGSEDNIYFLEFFKKEFPTTQTWLDYLNAIEPTEPELLQAFADCGWDYKSGHEVFVKLRELYSSEGNAEKLQKLYERMLSIPHAQIEGTYQDYSPFVSATFPDSYSSLMKNASSAKKACEATIPYYIKLEQNIADDPFNPQHWIAYIESCAKHMLKNASFVSIEQIFFRSLMETSKVCDESWLPVWKSFLSIVEQYEESRLPHFTKLFIKCFPDLPDGYTAFNKLDLEDDEFNRLRTELLRLVDAFKADDNWKQLATTLLVGDFKQYAKVSETWASIFLEDINTIASNAFAREDGFEVLQLAITLARRCSTDEDAFFDLFVDLTTASFDKWAHSAKVWVFCFQLLALYGPPKYGKRMLKLLPEDLSDLDDPKLALDTALAHQAMHGSAEEIQSLLDLLEKTHPRLMYTPAKMDIKRTNDEELEGPGQKKVRSENKPEEANEDASRSREMFRVKVENLPLSAKKDEVANFFQGYCDPLSIDVFSTVQGHFALVELKSEEEVMKALVRDQKAIGESIVTVKRIFGNTLWLTNYPSHWGLSDVESFLKAQDLLFLSVRFPSQSDKREKRFCYIDFPDTTATQSAQAQLDQLSHKRSGPNVAHQVYVHNINFEVTTEETLRQFFSGIGRVEDVKVPLNETNRAKGFKNNGYAFVTFSDVKDVKKALDANETVLDGRTIHVSKGKTKQAMQSSPSQFNVKSTIALFNVNSISTKAHLEEFLQSRVGSTTKVFLKPSKRAALVEFENESDAGKASLSLEGTLFDEEVLHVGSKDDFFKQENDQKPAKKTTMAPPMLMRRKRR
ncbi:uncharacterized protein CXQ87_000212 [Candidozyma duobushaemuli]|uniref:RRM domain-containing protein n=1 Tax=Candidozyma duobushaemuli TaxID=1231522 RepID=A0A2V1AHD8_9ASCO|nr:uncharacterized protein CXQ87_000212 [[Candida] duobushaemulonis]PVH17328.1 hypothetical protein CXQ87_000212 [[Candida] duobushaemulonis]